MAGPLLRSLPLLLFTLAFNVHSFLAAPVERVDNLNQLQGFKLGLDSSNLPVTIELEKSPLFQESSDVQVVVGAHSVLTHNAAVAILKNLTATMITTNNALDSRHETYRRAAPGGSGPGASAAPGGSGPAPVPHPVDPDPAPVPRPVDPAPITGSAPAAPPVGAGGRGGTAGADDPDDDDPHSEGGGGDEQGSSKPSPGGGGLSSKNKLGIGLGVTLGLGIPLLIILIYWCYHKSKRHGTGLVLHSPL
ncbi:hypothetical protein BT96DRAFT_1024119 [Gymnopus androsaceus JB14]|uniref:Mid2 domain-containing protein n=1 Tax=Gymnopus androsaceus JB14 TaxID=1447944 RepID=A0A6A4GZV8_9AGAR|nr:hypothetical protein BT96DRAFT_1024119 [Gymnopus androsaceus JB14]